MDIAVCDDNLSDREIIRQQLSIYFSDRFIEYNIDSYENGVNLIYSIEDGEYYDIIFLDMYMDKLNGIQVAEKLRNMNYKGKIIFLTATSKYAPGERTSWETMTRSAPFMTKVPEGVMRGKSPIKTSLSLISPVSLLSRRVVTRRGAA